MAKCGIARNRFTDVSWTDDAKCEVFKITKRRFETPQDVINSAKVLRMVCWQ